MLMGDEMGRTKNGNNNTYCHDNELTWLNWDKLDENTDLFRFFQQCIAFRHAHPILRNRHHFSGEDILGTGYPDISWHGIHAWQPDWEDYSRTLAYMLDGAHAMDGMFIDDMIYVAMNMHWEPHTFELPELTDRRQWYRFLDTNNPAPHDVVDIGDEVMLDDQHHYGLAARSVIVLVGR